MLLLLVALSQGIRTREARLSAWKGGGFGMFAVVDQRFMTARATGPDGSRSLPVDSLPRDLVRRAEYAPSDERLERVAARLWRAAGPIPAVPDSVAVPDSAADRDARPTGEVTRSPPAVRVVVWRVRFDGGSGRLWREQVRQVTYRPRRAP